MKNFTINQKEKDAILEMHIKATQRLYLTEQQNKVQGTLKTAEKTQMMKSYSDSLKKIEDENQIFVIGNTEGVVSVAGNSNQLKGKFFKSTDTINFDGKGSLLVYPKGMVDQQFSIQPWGGRLALFVGA